MITPDNYDKKFLELRSVMFGDLKTPDEAGYDETKDAPMTENLNEENMKQVVSTIFRKAQNEKEYCSFYGNLCEQIIRLELTLRGKKLSTKSIKYSEFRKTLLEFCKQSFDQFFDKDIAKKEQMDEEAVLKFKDRLLGNIQFVGELNRRNLLSENILISVFDMLLAVKTGS